MPHKARRNPLLTSVSLWIASIAATLICFGYQDTTGPTYPLEGEIETSQGVVRYLFLRSETIGTGLQVMLVDPVPEGVSGSVRYRRFKSNDDWSTAPLERGSFSYSRRGVSGSVEGLGAVLPSLDVRAGKYEYYVLLDDGAGEPVSVTGGKPIYARYKAYVPVWILVMHIIVVFASMTLAARSGLEALVDGNFRWMLWAAISSLLIGAFVLGPIVQWYAFGVLWSGFPFGHDWTDNKVLVELAFWLLAAYANRGERRSRRTVALAAVVTLVIYFIPHSLFGSEYDFIKGSGHGTAG